MDDPLADTNDVDLVPRGGVDRVVGTLVVGLLVFAAFAVALSTMSRVQVRVERATQHDEREVVPPMNDLGEVSSGARR